MCCHGFLSFSTHCLCYYSLYYKAPYFFCILSCHSFSPSFIWLMSTYLARRLCTLVFLTILIITLLLSSSSIIQNILWTHTHINNCLLYNRLLMHWSASYSEIESLPPRMWFFISISPHLSYPIPLSSKTWSVGVWSFWGTHFQRFPDIDFHPSFDFLFLLQKQSIWTLCLYEWY